MVAAVPRGAVHGGGFQSFHRTGFFLFYIYVGTVGDGFNRNIDRTAADYPMHTQTLMEWLICFDLIFAAGVPQAKRIAKR